MARRPDDQEELDYKNIRPGDIDIHDDIFEVENSDYKIDDSVDDEVDDYEEDDEITKKYMFSSDDEIINDSDEKDSDAEETVESSDNIDDKIDDKAEEEFENIEETMIDSEEKEEEIDENNVEVDKESEKEYLDSMSNEDVLEANNVPMPANICGYYVKDIHENFQSARNRLFKGEQNIVIYEDLYMTIYYDGTICDGGGRNPINNPTTLHAAQEIYNHWRRYNYAIENGGELEVDGEVFHLVDDPNVNIETKNDKSKDVKSEEDYDTGNGEYEAYQAYKRVKAKLESEEKPVEENKSEEEKDDLIHPRSEEYKQEFYKNLVAAEITYKDESERDKETKHALIKVFENTVNAYFDKYSEKDVCNYIKDFIDDEDNRDYFRETFIREYAKYGAAIDFEHNEVAMSNLWALVGCKFADYIEELKSLGCIESEVVSSGKPTNLPGLIEDENIVKTREYKKAQEEKYAEYKLDRTIFDITDDEDEENCSIFDDKRTLHKDFYESEFYSIHKEIMTSDRFADMSKINSRVIINEATSYIPVIDYSTGVRVICIDTNDTDQYRLNVQIISRKIPFSYQTAAGRGIKLRVLYLDDIKNRPMAVICALKKLIAFKYIKDRYKIKLNRNYVISYTTEAKWVEMFEKGDPDSHKPENSPTFQTKPANLTIGIIILDRKTYKDKRAIRRSQIMRDTNSKYEPVCAEDYDAQFVISARITKNDLRLRNPTLPKEERYVEYQITQYNEANPVIILDGFQVITACIIKEHKENYAPGTPYAISYEYDRGGLVSPSVVSMLDENDGVELSYNQRPNSFDVDGEYILPPSRLKLDGVFDFEVGRLDKRLFSPATIQRRYPRELWNNYDLTTKDGRIQFIRSRGFEEFLKPKSLIFDVMPYALNMLETGQMISDILKINPTSLYDRNSRDAENLLFKQSELNYKKSLGDSTAGKFQMFLIETIDQWIDSLAQKNKNE